MQQEIADNASRRLIFGAPTRELRNRWVKTLSNLIGKEIDTSNRDVKNKKDTQKKTTTVGKKKSVSDVVDDDVFEDETMVNDDEYEYE